jgi:TolB-like protein
MAIFVSYFAFFTLCLVTPARSQDDRPSLAVLDFQSSGEVSSGESSTLTNRFRGLLVNTRAFTVLEREEMSEILKEQDFVLTDACNTQECVVEVGQLLGAQRIVAVHIGKIGQTYTIDVRMIDVTSGKILTTQAADYKGTPDGLLQVMQGIAEALAGSARAGASRGKFWYIAAGAAVIGGGSLIFLKGSSSGTKRTVGSPPPFPN